MKLTLRRPANQPLSSDIVLPEAQEHNTGGQHLSFTQIAMYLRCSMQYYFRYVLGIKTPPEIPLASGKGLHAALEWNARHKMKTKEDMPLDDLKDMTADMLDIELNEIEGQATEKGEAKDESIAQVALFRLRDAPSIQPLAVEYPFTLVIPGDDEYPDPPLPVIGFVDTYSELDRPRSNPGGTARVIALEDYKRVNQKRNQLEVDLTPQLTLYDMVFFEQTGALPDVIGLRQFTHTKKDGAAVTPIYRSPELMEPTVRFLRWERMKQQVRRVQDAIRKGVFIPTDDSKTCSWCGYRQMCQFSLVKTNEPPRTT